MLEKIKPYYKTIVQVLATMAVSYVAAATGDDVVTSTEWFNIIAVGFGALSVLSAGETLTGFWKFSKTYASAGAAAAVFVASAVTDSAFSTTEIVQTVLAFLFAAGVAIVPGPKVVAEPSALTGVIHGRHEV